MKRIIFPTFDTRNIDYDQVEKDTYMLDFYPKAYQEEEDTLDELAKSRGYEQGLDRDLKLYFLRQCIDFLLEV